MDTEPPYNNPQSDYRNFLCYRYFTLQGFATALMMENPSDAEDYLVKEIVSAYRAGLRSNDAGSHDDAEEFLKRVLYLVRVCTFRSKLVAALREPPDSD